MPIDSNELLQGLRNNQVLRNALHGLPISGLTLALELGALVLGRNELGIYDLVATPDPSAIRTGARRGGLGKWSGNIMVPWPDANGAHVHWQPVDVNGAATGPVQHFREEEGILIQVKQDERWTHLDPLQDRRAFSGVVTIHLRNGALDGDGMVKVFELAHDYLWTPWFQCGAVPGDPYAPGPVSPPLGGGGNTALPTRRFYTDDGRYCYHAQGPASGQPDGTIIKYDTHHSADESTWTALTVLAEGPLP